MSDSSTRKSASSPAYHSVSRTRTESSMVLSCRRVAFAAMVPRAFPFLRFDSRRFTRDPEKISRPSPGVQQRLARFRINLPPQAVNVHFGQVGKQVEAFVPYGFAHFRAPPPPAPVARPGLQPRALPRRHREG